MSFIHDKVNQALNASKNGDAQGVKQAFNELLAENDTSPRETLLKVYDLVMPDDAK
ncbi:hypothetical protein [Saccharothrix deserti]|uniref:hypothetical protein n=1 Tax=Saccharothrix deserti TaxID=2593674 RepID=UPI00131BAC8F|nr:hypothetical protein [Saccharothrix deserti]